MSQWIQWHYASVWHEWTHGKVDRLDRQSKRQASVVNYLTHTHTQAYAYIYYAFIEIYTHRKRATKVKATQIPLSSCKQADGSVRSHVMHILLCNNQLWSSWCPLCCVVVALLFFVLATAKRNTLATNFNAQRKWRWCARLCASLLWHAEECAAAEDEVGCMVVYEALLWQLHSCHLPLTQ